MLPLDRPIVLHGSVDEVDAAAVGLRAVGFLELAGFLTDVPATERMRPVALDEAASAPQAAMSSATQRP